MHGDYPGHEYHLHRATYRTDATDDEPQYAGMESGTIPGRALREREIVGVDWSVRGQVTVTFLLPGPGVPG